MGQRQAVLTVNIPNSSASHPSVDSMLRGLATSGWAWLHQKQLTLPDCGVQSHTLIYRDTGSTDIVELTTKVMDRNIFHRPELVFDFTILYTLDRTWITSGFAKGSSMHYHSSQVDYML